MPAENSGQGSRIALRIKGHTLLARIVRQYRRFLFGSLLLTMIALLGAALGLADLPMELATSPAIFTLAWLILLVLIVGLPIIILAVVMPGLLPLIEIWGITLLLSGLLDPIWRALAYAAYLPGWSYCIYLVVLFICVERTLYGPWFTHLLRRDMKRHSATFTVPGNPAQIWCSLAPDPAHQGDYYWPKATFLAAPESSKADFILSLPRRGGYKDALLKIHVDQADPPRQISYHADPLPGGSDPAHAVDILIEPADNGQCRVTYSQQYLAVPIGKRLFYYLNHDYRDTLASLRAQLGATRDHSLQGGQMLRS